MLITSREAGYVDEGELELAVKATYSLVADAPRSDFHFETGRALAERLGYDPARLDAVPSAAVESFAGVGHHFDLAQLTTGESVVDLGSGSGMDAFVAATYVGNHGRVAGVEMTEAQRRKAESLRNESGAARAQIAFFAGRIETLPFESNSVDCVMSNGVINLVADKQRVFDEAARVLRPGGRMALSDIVTSVSLPPSVTCNATLWAACIGGAAHRDDYQREIEEAGLVIEVVRTNPQYEFLPGRAKRSADKYAVTSLSLVARKP